MMRAGLFLGGGRLAGRMMADKIGGQGMKNQTQARRPQEEPQPRRGLIGGARSMLGNVGGFLQNENGGVSNLDRIGLAAAMMRDDPSFALAAQQGIDRQQSTYQQRQQEMQEAQGQRNTQEKQAEQERQRLDGQARALGMDPAEFSMLPLEVQSDLLARQYTPEAQEPNLRAFGGNMYDFSDPQNPRMVMQGQEPRRDIETVVIDGRLVNRRTGEMIADYSDPNEGQPGVGDFNQQQTMAAEYASRMERAGNVVDQLYRIDDPDTEEDESAENQLNPTARVRVRNIGIPGTNIDVGTAFAGDSVRQYEQAVDEFALALLRRESGAAISASEREEVARTYFPQPGDGPQTVQQKAEARRSVINGMRQASGGAYDVMFSGGGRSSGGSFDSMSDEELERIANGG